MAVDAGAGDVADVRGGKSESRGNYRGSAGREAVRAAAHFCPASFAEAGAGSAVEHVVDAHVRGLEAAQALVVGGVDYGVDSEPADVAAPNGDIAARAGSRKQSEGEDVGG